jgi:NAD(P)-dependent dehydrogenase (short-subunit alcohol dehydrogenase family)
MSDRPLFSGQIAIVTGAARGIGRALAGGLARHGAKVIVADLDGKAAALAATDIARMGDIAHSIEVDVSDVTDVERLFQETVDTFGTVDILINNAGIAISKPILEYGESDWDRQMAVNVKGAFFCTQAAARIMIPKRRGKIVNLASVVSFIASKDPEIAYDTSKGAIKQLTVSSGTELAPFGISVNAIAPGTILTEMTTLLLDTDEKQAAWAEDIPIRRLGTPEDLIGPVIFLCSPASDYVVGHVLVVDGGRILF